MELHVHRQMLEVLNQQREEKLEHRDRAHDDKEPMMKIPHSESNKGEYKTIEETVKWRNSFALKILLERGKMKQDSYI